MGSWQYRGSLLLLNCPHSWVGGSPLGGTVFDSVFRAHCVPAAWCVHLLRVTPVLSGSSDLCSGLISQQPGIRAILWICRSLLCSEYWIQQRIYLCASSTDNVLILKLSYIVPSCNCLSFHITQHWGTLLFQYHKGLFTLWQLTAVSWKCQGFQNRLEAEIKFYTPGRITTCHTTQHFKLK